jgi:hypothetical protein
VTGKKTGVLICMAVTAFAALILCDWGLRAQNRWYERKEVGKANTRQPFLAELICPSPKQAYFQAMEIVDYAEESDSQYARADFYFQAIGLLKDRDNAEYRLSLLRRVRDECPDIPRSSEAWALLIRAKLDEKPSADPAGDVARLVECIRRFGVGEENVSDKVVQDAVKALQKPFPKQAETLQSALDAAKAKSSGKK